jgi:hypothetical protein
MVCSALFIDAIQQQEEQEDLVVVGQLEAHHCATSSPNGNMCDTDDVIGSTPVSLTPPKLPLGWILCGRDSNDDDHDPSFISSQSDSAERTIPRTTADHESARALRTETKTTTTAERYHHQQQTRRLSFMVSNSLLWMVTMVRNAVLA